MTLSYLLTCLYLVQACVAPAVSDATSNSASSILDTSFSFASSDPTPNTCKDIDQCRTMVGIVTSCLATIFACIWVAVHPNMPGPEQSWVSRQFESFKLVVVTLMVPEWVLAWAVRQYLQARQYGKILEATRLEADADAAKPASQAITNNQYTKSSSSDEGDEQSAGIGPEEQSALLKNSTGGSIEMVGKSTRAGLDDERTKFACRQYLDATAPGPENLALANAVLWEVEHDLGRTNESWTTAHGFLAIMGGFYCYQNGKPMFPLQVQYVCGGDPADNDEYILALVKSRSLVPPTSDELGDRSKGDALSKTIAVLQTLWFVAQCIARRIGNLAITHLEIVTLAYTVITVAMYAAWWHKPLNVRCPIRVKGDAMIVKRTGYFRWTGTNILFYVIGEQDWIFNLRDEKRVPTFWSSCSSGPSGRIKLPLYADIIALIVAMVFGAVHCVAWSYVFPSLAERRMWRVCAITIAAIPLPMAAAFAVSDPFNGPSLYSMLSMAIGALLYISARILLLVLSFTTLRHLPLSAFQTVQWTTWIPHV
ncbi:hypothetical protein FIBSPDRAFT_937362 [Athelia psychrophila]|uniref:Uncharacterized protein n=1 Tax=Athelia psychrophila TaxID=1759441 RepID=A0A166AMN0_9AGAM|nr:hypothetical protein FIBSPDRAFT_937362 [Fibularhizoctonia sp. CBS 109695]